jgi:ferrous iron transport protein B
VVSFGDAVKKAVSTLLYLPQPEEPEEEQGGLKEALQGQFTPLSAPLPSWPLFCSTCPAWW